MPSEWGGDKRHELQREVIRHTDKVTDDLLLGEMLVAMSRNALLPLSAEAFRQLYSEKLGNELSHVVRLLTGFAA
jgi:hypothetical protein